MVNGVKKIIEKIRGKETLKNFIACNFVITCCDKIQSMTP
jgi:hypothetical protein